MLRSLAAGLVCAVLAAGTLTACGDDEGGSIFIETLGPNITVPVGTTTKLTLKLSSSPSTDQFIDIKNDYKEFLIICEGEDCDANSVVDSVRVRPKDDPPQKVVAIKAIKANDQQLPITFTLRGATNLGSEQTIKIRPEGI
jgi:hypothetical protein